MSTGHKIILMILAIHRLRIAMAASPAPRKIPLMRKSKIMTTLPPSMMRVKVVPSLTTSSEAPMIRSISAANTIPIMLIITVTASAITIDCIPACAAASGFFSPIRLATTAVAAVLKPIAIE